ncbi:AMP-dependent synthetase/ligase [Pisolithus croceorrhizus]|nr:AMP-dependent synthetase/ligase [Pisolithus croceorrhizus]
MSHCHQPVARYISPQIMNAQLNEQVDAFGGGISHMFQEDSDVLLLLNDSNKFLIADLALMKYSIAAMTLCSPKLLSHVLETHPPTAIITNMKFIPLLLEYEGKHHQKTAKQVEITPWVQIKTDGTNKMKQCPDDLYMLTFFEAPSGRMQAVQFTHENMTSGVAAIQALFPPSMALSSIDIIVSNHSLSTPYGLAIVYSTLHEGMSFVTIDSTRLYNPHNLADMLSARCHPIPYLMVFFIGLDHLEDLSSSILRHAGESWLYSFMWKHKLAAFAEGFLSKDSLWGHTVFDHAWEHVLGDMANALKDVIISGGPISSKVFMPAWIALSIPMINMHVNPWVSGPVFMTQTFNAQVLPSGHKPVHVGGLSIDMEAKLKGVKGMYLEDNKNPVGEIVVHGPTVGQEISEISHTMTNGVFKADGLVYLLI